MKALPFASGGGCMSKMLKKKSKRPGPPSGTWNHRVVRRYCPTTGAPYLVMTEVHYTGGKPYGFALDWTVQGFDYDNEGNAPESHTDKAALNELRFVLKGLQRALDEPILDEKDFILK
jgi:hypothetical protein